MNARLDISRGAASYYILGMLSEEDVKAFSLFFEEYGIHPVPTGCVITPVISNYSSEYNQIVESYLSNYHGRNLIQEYNDARQSEH